MARVVLHGHFYQPPRENPWTGEIDRQPTAAPFHDWNERVHAECYRPNAFANIVTPTGEAVVNNFERLSFNVGPTLLTWMETVHPETYRRIRDADRASIDRLGYGNAIAQAFHHTILPLDSRRDARTQIRWGLADFRHRFGREADGMWLAETAANDEVLELLIDEGVGFTILAPWQAAQWREPGGSWVQRDAEPFDTRLPYKWVIPDGSGRAITLFFYDGDAARGIAFEQATSSAERFVDMLGARGDEPHELVHAATDGETYGHHHKFGDIGLAYALFVEAERRGIEVTNYASHAAQFPAEIEVQLVPGEGSSWSCEHGVGRWTRDCGCSTGGEAGWDQAWRGPLRHSFDILRDAAHDVFDEMGAGTFHDAWAARDRYVQVVIGKTKLDDFLQAEMPADGDAGVATKLLDLQHNAMSMYSSCGWFFSDVGGIETVQVMRYAARVFDVLEALGCPVPSQRVVEILAEAKSNDPSNGTAADIFEALRRTRRSLSS